MKTYYSNGKLLLSGEYVVLDGALSLALPTKFGQSLTVESINDPKLVWKSFDEHGFIWFECEFSIEEIALGFSKCTDDVSVRLIQILNTAKQLNPNFLNSNTGFRITTQLDFPKSWGLGTSSTLINNIAQWANVDAYMLLEKTFGGSGYDIACAQHNHPISYQLQNEKRIINKITFNPSFKKHLYFVYLNKKQDSRAGILQYKENKVSSKLMIAEISDISSKMVACKSLEDFEKSITLHEQIISKIIKQRPIKELQFNDFNGCIKSLGAWGGDFILVTSKTNPREYFKNKGLETILSFDDMIFKN